MRATLVRRLPVALVVLLVALVGLSAWLFVQAQQASSDAEAYDDASAAARAEVLAFTTLDYRKLDASLDRVVAGATGSFKSDFSKQRKTITQLTKQNKSVSKSRVPSAGVVSIDQDSARVIVVADSTVTNATTKTPQPRHYRMQVDLVLRDGDWLTSNLEFVNLRQ